MARNTFAQRLRKMARRRDRELAWMELPSHYMQAKKKLPPMTTAEAGRKRWEGTTPEQRSEIARQAVLRRWHPKKKRIKKSP